MQAELILHSLGTICQGGLVSIAVAATLSAMSIVSWTLMATKAIQIRRVRGSGRQFVTHLWEALSATDHVQRPPFSSGVAALPAASTCGFGDMQSAIKTAINRHPKNAENPFARLALQGLNAADHHNRYVTQRPDEVRSYDEFMVMG